MDQVDKSTDANSIIGAVHRSSHESGVSLTQMERPAYHRVNLCKVCNHPEKEAIEAAYSNWQTRSSIAKDFGVSANSIGTHIRALRLDMKRYGNTDGMLDRIIQKGMKTLGPVDCRTLHAAIRLKMERSGQLDNTAKTNIVIISPGDRQDRLKAGLKIFGVALNEKPIISQVPTPIEIPQDLPEPQDAEFEEVDASTPE